MTKNITYIDLGTANTTVFSSVNGRGIKIPTLLAFNKKHNNVSLSAFGNEAQKILGRTPSNYFFVSPLESGVIANAEATQLFLKKILEDHCLTTSVRKSTVLISLPQDCNSSERLAVREAANSLRPRHVQLLSEPLAAAFGLGQPLFSPKASVVLDIGAGTTECSIISLGRVHYSCSERIGGFNFTQKIQSYLSENMLFDVGPQTAENVKRELVMATANQSERCLMVAGYDRSSGWPTLKRVAAHELHSSYAPLLTKIKNLISRTFEGVSPEVSGDILDQTVEIVGGGSLIKGLPEWLTEQLGVKFKWGLAPLDSVARGGKSLALQSEILSDLEEPSLNF